MAKVCPSSPPDIADNILGLIGKNGLIKYLPFKVEHSLSKNPEITRYTTQCISNKCAHWNIDHCEWTDKIKMAQIPTKVHLTKYCNIRTECRWYYQVGKEACASCPLIHGEKALLSSKYASGEINN